MVKLAGIASSIGKGVGRTAGSSATAIAGGLRRFSPDASSFQRFGGQLTTSGRRVGTSARRGADNAADSAKRTGNAFKKSVSKGSDSLTTGAKRQARGAGDWIATSSKSGMKRMGRMCRNNPAKCTAAMALAGYTAVNLAENSQAQQECITKCLPPNWPAVVEADGEIAPEYFLHDPKPNDNESTDETGTEHKQPQCTNGTDCEPYCVAACKAEHPTTLLGAAIEGVGEIMDDIIVPVVEDGIGIPITDIGGGFMWGIRIAVFLVGAVVIYRVGQILGLWKAKKMSSSGGGRVEISLNNSTPAPAPAPAPALTPAPAPTPAPTPALTPALTPAPTPQLSGSQVQLANRAMDLAEKNPELARMGMQMMQQNQQRMNR